MTNVWTEFEALLPSTPLTYGQVLQHISDGRSRVELPSGAVVVVDGQGVAAGSYCWMQGGRITGEAPAMESYTEYV